MTNSKTINKTLLAKYGKDIFSQNGEDGILEYIFSIIGSGNKISVEFGAWDGFHLSNTANLWANNGWQGILIEGEKKRHKKLVKNVSDYNCKCICAFVSSKGSNSIETLLTNAGIESEVDLLSIDIDGDDYYILKSLNKIKPRVVVCEYNPTIPAGIDLYGPEGNYFGASANAINRIALQKGYSVISVTNTNLIFVLAEYIDLFNQFETKLEKLMNPELCCYVINSFNGDILFSKPPMYGLGLGYTGKLLGDPFYSVSNSYFRIINIRIRRFLGMIKRTIFRLS